MNYLDWLLPLLLVFVIFIGAVKIAPSLEKDNALGQGFNGLKHWIVANYVLVIVVCMIICPLLLQAVYSIPLCYPAVSSDSVLEFWGGCHLVSLAVHCCF